LLTAINGFRPNVPPYPMRQRIQVTLDALKTLADRMSGAAGRKSIVWITGGFPRIRAYDGTIQKTLNKVNDSNVAIYPIDARGLTLGARHPTFRPWNSSRSPPAARLATTATTFRWRSKRRSKIRSPPYAVGFYLGDKDRDHRFHELKVEVDRPGAMLRYRRGYSPPATSRNLP
jgi:hypothetical protein